MEIKKVILNGLFFYLFGDKGKFAVYRNYRELEQGAVQMVEATSHEAVGFPVAGLENDTGNMVTDAVIVCTARRDYAWGNLLGTDASGKFPIPTREEALAEIASGKDLWGNEWPIPQVEEREF